MKRDMDLVRAIVHYIEDQNENDFIRSSEIELAGWTSEQIAYHCMLIEEAGLVEAVDLRTRADRTAIAIQRLTWQGHDFADASRNDSLWNRVKMQVANTATAVTFDVLVAVLKAQAAKMIGAQD